MYSFLHSKQELERIEAEVAKLQKIASAARALLDECDRQGLLLGGGRSCPNEQEGPLVKQLRKALEAL